MSLLVGLGFIRFGGLAPMAHGAAMAQGHTIAQTNVFLGELWLFFVR